MIEIGEYIRTNYGRIRKVINNNYFMPIYLECENETLIDRTKIVKHSKNIIDLIEAGDYVNDYKILNIANLNNSDEKVFTIHKSNFKDICKIWGNEDIKKILTHEKYEKECYRIGE